MEVMKVRTLHFSALTIAPSSLSDGNHRGTVIRGQVTFFAIVLEAAACELCAFHVDNILAAEEAQKKEPRHVLSPAMASMGQDAELRGDMQPMSLCSI